MIASSTIALGLKQLVNEQVTFAVIKYLKLSFVFVIDNNWWKDYEDDSVSLDCAVYCSGVGTANQ